MTRDHPDVGEQAMIPIPPSIYGRSAPIWAIPDLQHSNTRDAVAPNLISSSFYGAVKVDGIQKSAEMIAAWCRRTNLLHFMYILRWLLEFRAAIAILFFKQQQNLQ